MSHYKLRQGNGTFQRRQWGTQRVFDVTIVAAFSDECAWLLLGTVATQCRAMCSVFSLCRRDPTTTVVDVTLGINVEVATPKKDGMHEARTPRTPRTPLDKQKLRSPPLSAFIGFDEKRSHGGFGNNASPDSQRQRQPRSGGSLSHFDADAALRAMDSSHLSDSSSDSGIELFEDGATKPASPWAPSPWAPSPFAASPFAASTSDGPPRAASKEPPALQTATTEQGSTDESDSAHLSFDADATESAADDGTADVFDTDMALRALDYSSRSERSSAGDDARAAPHAVARGCQPMKHGSTKGTRS